ncbi:hypothetical protein RD792_009225 [Penstemon davidsonii]|uniref:Glycerol-3-phosphate acyltransferase, chloroplastic n=1 Tax=Penstemon davidsonii TaxID=160366 RepID=A0ABR0DBC3_9LAMI|nr:hypothetical protein RD792_009225 [Penstemon davidsonii]
MISSLSFSSSSSTATLFTCSTAPRVSTSRISCFVKTDGGGGGVWRRSRCPYLVLCTSKFRGVADMLDEENSYSRGAAAAPAVAASSSVSDQREILHPRTFLDARSGEDLLLGIQKETEAGRLPINVAQAMEELYLNYRNAVLQSGHPNANEIVLSNMAVALDRIFMDVRDPFQFSPHHEAIREPFDYYLFGQKYIRALVDFRSSFLGNMSIFNEMEKKLHQGENIILVSNHQSEADPAVISLLLESTSPFIAENMICVAGDRVVTDPLCKPFSMGRNLLCVYSKKHMNDDPELIDMKKKANTKKLGERDGPAFEAPFDASAVDNMRRLTEHAGVPGHIYPLAVLCYDIMPPPPQVEKDIGEKRMISFHGVGLSVARNINYHETTATLRDPEEAKMAYTQSLYSSVCEQYNVLTSAIHGKQGLKASTPTVSLSQPWL